MTDALLAVLVLELAFVLVYAVSEWRSARKYRQQYRAAQEEALTLDEALLRLVVRSGSGAILAGERSSEERQGQAETGQEVSESHLPSFQVSRG